MIRSSLFLLALLSLSGFLAASLRWRGATAVKAVTATPEEPFAFLHEYYGAQGYADSALRQNKIDRLFNGIALWPPVDIGPATLAGDVERLMLRLPAASGPAALPAVDIERQRLALAGLAQRWPKARFFWSLMPEWDQGGGAWVPKGRPSYRNLTRPQAWARFAAHYENTFPELLARLNAPVPGYVMTSVTDYGPNAAHAYELGVELQLLERGIDELGDLSTGIAFVRGASRQANRPWGIDLSSWRTSTDRATIYDANGRLLGGWSAEYFERLYYLSFAAGAHMLHNEPVIYRYPDGRLNPLGEATARFADFALRRHPDIGKPTVNVALLTDHFSGFDPKHGLHNQANAVWYQDIPYSAGDYMFDNFLRLAFPGHHLHGLTPGAPFADRNGIPDPVGFTRFLAQGGDVRPYEPMPTTRWGDNLDILTTHATADAFLKYRVIILMGEVSLDARLREALANWVEAGGVLVMNAAQAGVHDEALTGISQLPAPALRGAQSRWLHDSQPQNERAYMYAPVRVGNAEVLAVSGAGLPLVTRRPLGRGLVYFTTPEYLQAADRSGLLEVGRQLFDSLVREFEPVRIEGQPIEYVVTRATGRIVVTLANHAAEAWTGAVVAPRLSPLLGARELVTERPLAYDEDATEIAVSVAVPPYGVRVVSIDDLDLVLRRPAK